ncbi:hypothetical protein RvY_15150 [Ramazzottius varieornatus]|uniref:Uncharacterized protein n=1 Tax=Ramazzottius varieornatus TaxID=947166 RepID=A0A1D1VV88_RAMVA|nr:hypothetical protein RvY_15150 [Ramazzottius varieornatus]
MYRTVSYHSKPSYLFLQGDGQVSGPAQAQPTQASGSEEREHSSPGDDVTSRQVQSDDLPYTVVTGKQRHQPVVWGKQQPSAQNNDPNNDGLFNLLKLNRPPHKDFLLKGIPNVEDTEFKTMEGDREVPNM